MSHMFSAEQLAGNQLFGSTQYTMTPEEQMTSALFGMTTEDITKALASSGTVGTDASSMSGESLDPVVKVLSLQSPNFTPKVRRFYTYEASAIAEEFTKLTALGLASGSFRTEGQLGVQDSSIMERVTKNVRFLGQVGAVTHEMQRASQKKFGNLKVFEATNRLHRLLLDFDRDIFWANSSINSLAFEGILQQMSSSATYNIDMATTALAGTRTTITAGGVLTISDVREKAETFLTTGGTPTALYLAPADKNSISAEEDSNLRWYAKDQNSPIATGMVVDQVQSDFGPIDLVWDIWLRNYRGGLTPYAPDPAGTFHASVPALPSVLPTGAVAAGGSLPVDVYYYGVSYVNEVGEGPIALQTTGYTTTNANGIVNVTATMPASVANIKSIRLYRSTTSGASYATMRLVKEDALTAVGGATQVLVDNGAIIPGSRTSVMMNERMTALGLLEAPNIFDLARIDNTHRFGINAMAVVQLYNTENCTRWHNLGGSVTDI